MIWAKDHLLQSGKYRIIQQLGGGGFGLTYLAEDQPLQRKVVIKAPNRTFAKEQDYEQFIRRFQREGQVLAKINHPNVVRVIEFFQEAGMPCLVMDYVEGETLNERIRRSGRLPETDAVQYFRQLATALQAVHQMGLIHCDIHPGNIILRQGAAPILIDFGSTKSLVPTTYTVTTTVNESFSPYEQRQGNPQPTLDVYGLAATLYFVVTGQKPQTSMDRKLYGDNLKPPRTHRSELSDWLNQAILKGMTLEAQDRSPSMQAWLGLLHPPQPKPQPTPVTPPKPQQIPKPPTSSSSNKPFPWIALGFLLLGYMPTGLVLGLSHSSSVAWAWVWAVVVAVAWAVAWAWAWAGALAWAGAGAGTLAGTGAMAGALALAWVRAGALDGALDGTWAVAVAVAVAGTRALAGTGALAGANDAWSWLILGSCLGGAIVGHFTNIGIWAGLGIGLLTIVQWLMMFGGMGTAQITLKKHHPPFTSFLIFTLFSFLGLAVGGCIGWWLKLSGVSLLK